ncbi:MAG: alcohol dehydrogenase catalytic domain-containing protein [bacterium]|nr:alcohol dehydrogenase catalytic domain-containing protein [bacterium]MCY3579763.1 alcohol dehydrogenase catalytic domain-containing protein [bacterium]MDE0643104.1 alcohol dehydrogenase catalytic domain-containing protein [bacterium]MYD03458.1 alcohol dehydrogenase catalytic domain-containing protein [Acidimicrobiia bacterium]MYH56373.1 alcohol dehydrogenase catalytic domain-containing protein [Acidimicrobiia bacterium]
MTGQMRVLVFDGPHRFHIETRPLPKPGPGEVRLRMAYVGICGSDLHGYTGESGRRLPGMIMGHEAAGWVDQTGSGVEGWEVGTPVTFNPSLPCDGGCGHRLENHCAALRVIGVTPDIQGAFADAIVLPAARVVRLDGLSLLWGAGVEPMAVALQSARRARIRPGQKVLVVGGGMIGQAIAQTCRLEGAAAVSVSDPMPHRRSLAEAGGFQALQPAQVEEAGPFDVSFDAVGITPTAYAAIQNIPKGAIACFVGLGLPEVSIPLFDVVVGERMVVGSFCYPDAVFEEALDHLSAGRLDLDPLIGAVVGFEEVAQAFEDLATGIRSDVKVMMSTGLPPG